MPKTETELPIARLEKYFADYNPRRISPHKFRALVGSIRDLGPVQRAVVNRRSVRRGFPKGSDPVVVGGHQRIRAAKEAGLTSFPVRWIDVDQRTEYRANVLLNNTEGEFVEDQLDALLRELNQGLGDDLQGLGFEDAEIEAFLAGRDARSPADGEAARKTLRERFLVPPFSVLDARQGYWRERKAAWIALGIESEVGRSGDAAAAPREAEGGRSKKVTPRKSAAMEGPLLLRSDSGRDPGYYKQKREVEKRLGRKISTEEFQRDHYVANEGASGLSVSGTSVFDPVLCELVYRWFAPPGGRVLDPFAGGSVRGVVAGALGRHYTGIELRPEQISANRDQAKRILPRRGRRKKAAPAPALEDSIADPEALTPVVRLRREKIWVKRDDLYTCNGARGSKARAILALLEGAEGATTAGNRHSPMAARVARIAEQLGIPSRCHMAGSRRLTIEEQDAERRTSCTLVKHKVNYLRALQSKAKKDAEDRGWVYVPLAGESQLYIDQTRKQVANLPKRGVKRIVVPVGTGLALASILHGMDDVGLKVPVVGISVGKDPVPYLDRWAPADWRDRVELVSLEGDFAKEAATTTWWGIRLDPHYEAKAAAYVEEGDLFWCVAASATLADPPADAEPGLDDVTLEGAPLPEWIEGDAIDTASLVDGPFDLVFSCPPYYDLERYSGDERDLSNAESYEGFLALYGKAIAGAAERLADDRFLVLVVGEVREKTYTGSYVGLVPDTIRLAREAGLDFYNEAVLVTTGGSLPVRVGRQFEISRKLGKTHQNVLVFVKGDWRRATEAIGSVQYGTDEGGDAAESADLDPPVV